MSIRSPTFADVSEISSSTHEIGRISLIKQHSSERTVNFIAVYEILNNLCHCRTARIKTFEILKTKGS